MRRRAHSAAAAPAAAHARAIASAIQIVVGTTLSICLNTLGASLGAGLVMNVPDAFPDVRWNWFDAVEAELIGTEPSSAASVAGVAVPVAGVAPRRMLAPSAPPTPVPATPTTVGRREELFPVEVDEKLGVLVPVFGDGLGV